MAILPWNLRVIIDHQVQPSTRRMDFGQLKLWRILEVS
jgi:hypothetical protein